MNENEMNLKRYDFISEDVKYAANSIIRLRILAELFKKPQNVTEIAKTTKLNYSSISATLHGLELKDFIYRESNRYHLSNYIRLQMTTMLEFKDVVNLVENFFNIIFGHTVDMLPKKSVEELFLLRDAELLESSGVDAYRIYNFIETALKNANSVRGILPFYQVNFNEKLNELVKDEKFVELYACEDVFDIYEERSDIKYLSSFKGRNNFLLIVTDQIMILGFFNENGCFDQNRLLISENKNSLRWAYGAFLNFKNENK